MEGISPELMKMMQGGADGNQPPAGASDAAPQDNAGEKMQARAKVQSAMTVLEQSLTLFGSGSDEGKCVLASLTTLSKQFGEDREKGRELIPSEVMNMMGGLPGAAGGSPTAQQPGGGMQAPPGGAPMPNQAMPA